MRIMPHARCTVCHLVYLWGVCSLHQHSMARKSYYHCSNTCFVTPIEHSLDTLYVVSWALCSSPLLHWHQALGIISLFFVTPPVLLCHSFNGITSNLLMSDVEMPALLIHLLTICSLSRSKVPVFCTQHGAASLSNSRLRICTSLLLPLPQVHL